MSHLSTDEFLKRLRELLGSAKEQSSVALTHQRHTPEDDATTTAMQVDASTSDRTYPVLLQATDDKDVEFSTLIPAEDMITFQAAYTLLLRNTFAGSLRKRDKKKEKDRKKAAAAGPNGIAVLPKVEGPKRGAGRRKRVATLDARLKALSKVNAQRKRQRVHAAIDAKIAALTGR